MLTGDFWCDQNILMNLCLRDVISFFSIDPNLDQEPFWIPYLKKWYPKLIREKTSAKEMAYLIFKWPNYRDYIVDHHRFDGFYTGWDLSYIRILRKANRKQEYPIYDKKLAKQIKIFREEEKLNLEYLNFLELRGELCNDSTNIYLQTWLAENKYFFYHSDEIPFQFRNHLFIFLDHPFFDTFVEALVTSEYIFSVRDNVDFFWGIGKGHILEKYEYKPSNKAVCYAIYPFVCRLWNGLVKNLEKEEQAVMEQIKILVDRWHLQIPEDIYEYCIKFNWIRGFKYFIDLNIPVSQLYLDLIE